MVTKLDLMSIIKKKKQIELLRFADPSYKSIIKTKPINTSPSINSFFKIMKEVYKN